MDPYERTNSRTAERQTRYLLDTIHAFGPLAGQYLAEEERRRDARQWAAVWSATHEARQRTPGIWRRRVGARLVRAGTRLQRVPTPRGAETQQSTS